jgi:hypothetical protein
MRAQFCPVASCNAPATPDHGMCLAHWKQVPWMLQQGVLDHKVRTGQPHGQALMRAIIAADKKDQDAA